MDHSQSKNAAKEASWRGLARIWALLERIKLLLRHVGTSRKPKVSSWYIEGPCLLLVDDPGRSQRRDDSKTGLVAIEEAFEAVAKATVITRPE